MLSKLGIQGTSLNTIKHTYEKSIANIVFNREILKAFASMIRTRKEVYSYHFFSNILLECILSAIRQEKELGGIYIRKEYVKLSQVTQLIIFIEDPKKSKK